MSKMTYLAAAVAAVAIPAVAQAQITVAQTNTTGPTAPGFTNTFGTFANSNSSGNRNYGQYFRLASSEAAFDVGQIYPLSSFTLVRGNANRATATTAAADFNGDNAANVDGTAVALQLYTSPAAPTPNPGGSPNFASATPGATLIATSTNTVDYTNATAFSELVFNFANTPLSPDTSYYGVLSSNGIRVGASLVQVSNGSTGGVFTNIDNVNSSALPTGVVGDLTTGAETQYRLNLIPEPTSLAFAGLAGMGLLARRRR